MGDVTVTQTFTTTDGQEFALRQPAELHQFDIDFAAWYASHPIASTSEADVKQWLKDNHTALNNAFGQRRGYL